MRSAHEERKQARTAIALALIIACGIACTRQAGGQTGAPPSSTPTTPTATNTPRPRALGLAVVALDGSVRRDLAFPDDAWMADLSPDGSRVAFLTRSPTVGTCGGCGSHDRLAVLRVGEPSGAFVYGEHAAFGRIEEPAWSPSGDRIAFVGVRGGGERDIFLADLTDGPDTPEGILDARVRRLTDDPSVDEFPVWSPDGTTIYYDNGGRISLDEAGFSPTQEIWGVPAAGGAPYRLTHDRVADAQADVAPDGTVLFWHGGEIWTMDPSGTHERRLRVVPRDIGFVPRVSPDGTKLALLRYAGDNATFAPRWGVSEDLPLLEVVVVDLTTGHVKPIGTRVASDVNPVSWTPDGSALLIDRFDDGA